MKVACTGTFAIFFDKRHDVVIEYPLGMFKGKTRVLENSTVNDFDNASCKLDTVVSIAPSLFFSFFLQMTIKTHMVDSNTIPIVNTSLFIF